MENLVTSKDSSTPDCYVESTILNIVTGEVMSIVVSDEPMLVNDIMLMGANRVFPMTYRGQAKSDVRHKFSASLPHDVDLQGEWRVLIALKGVQGQRGIRRVDVPTRLQMVPQAARKPSEFDLSICIPTYNRRDRILQAVNGILSHPQKNIEVVVCDNASPDDTVEALRQIDDPRLKVFTNKENYGPIRNFNLALGHGQGEYVFLHSDEDSVDVDAALELAAFLKQNPGVGAGLASVEGSKVNKDTRILAPGRDAMVGTTIGFSYLGGFFYRRELYDIGFLFSEYNNPNFLYPFENIAWRIAQTHSFCYFAPIVARRGVNDVSYFPKVEGRHFNHPVNLILQYLSRLDYFEDLCGEYVGDQDMQQVRENLASACLRQNFFLAYQIPLSEKFEVLQLANKHLQHKLDDQVLQSLSFHTLGEHLHNSGEDGLPLLRRAFEIDGRNSYAAFLLADILREQGAAQAEAELYAKIIEHTPKRWAFLFNTLGELKKRKRDSEVGTVESILRNPETRTPAHILEKLST